MPISGGDIVALGVKAGPDVARILRMVEDQWLVEGCPERNRALEMIADRLPRV